MQTLGIISDLLEQKLWGWGLQAVVRPVLQVIPTIVKLENHWRGRQVLDAENLVVQPGPPTLWRWGTGGVYELFYGNTSQWPLGSEPGSV